MCSIAKALDEIFRAHLQLEEETIFPAIREALPESMQSEMLREMQQRRSRD
jgi:hemerythrin-like domain-containing protein